jgi:hypothetical protein
MYSDFVVRPGLAVSGWLYRRLVLGPDIGGEAEVTTGCDSAQWAMSYTRSSGSTPPPVEHFESDFMSPPLLAVAPGSFLVFWVITSFRYFDNDKHPEKGK